MFYALFMLANSYFCPLNYVYDSVNKVCANDLNVLGPFSDEMIFKCKIAGGGSACGSNFWYKSFALKIRGNSFCPYGTKLLQNTDYCIDSKGIYGPFKTTEVQKCYKLASKSLCESMRWSADLAQIVGLEKEKNEVGLQVPYYFQLNNRYEPYATCGITSAAMLLGSHGINVTPDQLYRRFGKKKGQSPGGLASIYRAYGLFATSTYNASREDIKYHLDNGRPVVVHGWMSRPGHIFVITGYNSKGWLVNDPNGQWRGCYKCGFRTNLSGKQITYSYNSMYGQVIGFDGNIWVSTASFIPF